MLVAVYGALLAIELQHLTGTAPQFVNRGGRSYQTAQQVGRVVLVLPDILPGSCRRLPGRSEKLSPGIRLTCYEVPNQNRREGPQGHAVAGESCGNKLTLCDFTNIRQAVQSFENLPEPTMLRPRFWKSFLEDALQSLISRFRI